MKTNRLVAAIALAFVAAELFTVAVLAQTTTPANTTWNAGPLWSDVVLPLLAAVIPFCAAWLSYKGSQLLHLQSTGAMRSGLETAMNMGLQLAQAKLPPGQPITVQVTSSLAADALNYATEHAKSEIAFLGYSPDRVSESLKARAAALLPQVVSPAAAATMQTPPPSAG